jgi:hypothetical protein
MTLWIEELNFMFQDLLLEVLDKHQNLDALMTDDFITVATTAEKLSCK